MILVGAVLGGSLDSYVRGFLVDHRHQMLVFAEQQPDLARNPLLLDARASAHHRRLSRRALYQSARMVCWFTPLFWCWC
jgi:hypothetical protein